MFSMPGINWYTDSFDSFRVIATVDGGITKHERRKVLSAVPCRVYNNPNADISMSEQAATTSAGNTLCCDAGTDIKAGDEIIVSRSALIAAQPVSVDRYFAGHPNTYIEPFGGVIADLSHMQVALYNEKRVE